MLVFALVVSLGLLATLLLVSGARKGDNRAAALVVVLGVAAVLAYCVMFVLPPVLVQVALGLVALPLLALPRRGVRAYRLASVGSFVAGWAVAGGLGIWNEWEYTRLRAVYPFESLAGRLPPRSPGIPPVFDEQKLTDTDEVFDERGSITSNRRWSRTGMLRRLHEEQVGLFTETAGFGVGRMGSFNQPSAERLGEDGPTRPTPDAPLAVMVRDDALDFADPARWGYRRGDTVAGFLPHALRRRSGPAQGFAVETVELVGLLLAPDPRVYLSESLPRMDEVATAATRHPDGFELPALARLRAGDELVHDGPGGRLLGAIRAAGQCLQCHGGDRGDLLGEFSYRLRSR